jgi:hypothetical protein
MHTEILLWASGNEGLKWEDLHSLSMDEKVQAVLEGIERVDMIVRGHDFYEKYRLY